MQAFLARIHRLNPTFNAIVNLAPDDVLLAQAAEYDKELASGRRADGCTAFPSRSRMRPTR